MTQPSQIHKSHADKIWGRARANAFAHRAAADRYRCLANILFLMQLILGLLSLFLVIILYALISGDQAIATGKTPLLLTLGSVVYTMFGLGVSVMQNYLGYEQKLIGHNHNQHSFLYIAQRCREIESPSMTDERRDAVIDDLERDFQILKVRGQEPSDLEFRLGHEILKDISESQFGRLQTAQLAEIDGNEADEVAGQGIQEPSAVSEMGDAEQEKMHTLPSKKVGYFQRLTCVIVIASFVMLTGASAYFLYDEAAGQYYKDIADYSERLKVEVRDRSGVPNEIGSKPTE